MGESLQRAFNGIIALSLAIIAIQLIPLSQANKAIILCARLYATDFEAGNEELKNKRRANVYKKLLKNSGVNQIHFNTDIYCSKFN
tara:strand:+ start:436 stop:693 length:258 start_codon:yes stop_codon:yes gene_type:complete